MGTANAIEIHIPEHAQPETKLRLKLRALRNAREITQEELGRKVGELLKIPALTKGQVWNWEYSGNVPGAYIGAIATVLDVEMEFFRV